MPYAEASFNGTFRTILVLVAIWLVLRAILRARAKSSVSTGPRPRPKGDVRIEQPGTRSGSRSNGGDIIDADYEEIK
jgi:hypothetical protein